MTVAGDTAATLTLAVGHHQAGRLAEAEGFYRRILADDPENADALHLLGVVAHQTGRGELAVALIGRAIVGNDKEPAFHNNLGEALRATGHLAAAVPAYQQALARKPDYAEAWNNLGTALKGLRRFDDAITAYRRALAIKPDYFAAHSNLGAALRETGTLAEAEAAYRHALALKPDFAEAHNNLGNALLTQGRIREAVASYERAVTLKPRFAEAHHNLLMGSHYLPEITEETACANARRYAATLTAPPAPRRFANTPEPGRPLRVGYVSGDFQDHPVGFFLVDVLPAHARDAVEVFCYVNNSHADAMTARLKAAADHWRNIVGLPDAAVAALMADDGIDILVDLSGHTAGNRLPLFALRPAPVQVTWLGYFGTTGLSAMDYILADRYVVPAGLEAHYAESVWRLPDSYLCFSPPPFDLPVVPPPTTTGAPLTFGCFNNRTKISPDTVVLWARLLRRLPESRLLLKTRNLDDAVVRDALLKCFVAEGVAPERLLMEGHSPRADLLAAYGRVDIALDPFPFGGGTTTAEALWMGVPVVSLRGDRWAGRVSESILATVGHPEWVAADQDAYLEIAAALAADSRHLTTLRAGLREQVRASPLGQPGRFAANLEAAYRGMWRRWCEGQSAAAAP